MTQDEIKAWLLANGWSLHFVIEPTRGFTPCPKFQEECRNGKVLLRTENGDDWIVHFLKRDIRVVLRNGSKGVRRVLTTHPANVVIEDGVLRGLGLYSIPGAPHSPWKEVEGEILHR